MECVHNKLVPSTAFEAARNPEWYGPSLTDLNSHFNALIDAPTMMAHVDFSDLGADSVRSYNDIFGDMIFKAPVDDRQDRNGNYGDLTLVYVEQGIVKVNYRARDGQSSIIYWSDRAANCG